MKLISWNVNGIRAVHRKDLFLPFLKKEAPDILCLQETKAHDDQLTQDLLSVEGYQSFFSKPSKRGYSGVAIYTKPKPVSVTTDLDNTRFNEEGRALVAEYPKFTLLNVYFPNGASSDERLNYKMDFYRHFFKLVKRLKDAGKKVIVCGDVNTAHQEIDIYDPKDGEGVSGFLQIERQWLDQFFEAGYFDTYRAFFPKEKAFTWWDYRTGARERDDGWRIDYFIASNELKKKITAAFILPKVMGSDHCPVGIILE